MTKYSPIRCDWVPLPRCCEHGAGNRESVPELIEVL
jgi:hypothetical protein